MSTSNFNLRNVPHTVMSLLKKEAAKQKISVNSMILMLVDQGLGVTRPVQKKVFNDLDDLAGTWSAEDGKAFDDNIKSFETIDREFWI